MKPMLHRNRRRGPAASGGRAWLATALVAAAGSVLALSTGCRATLPADSAQDIPFDTNAALIESIAQMPLVTAEPAYRAIYILWTGNIYEGDFASLSNELEQAKIIGSAWDLPANVFIDRAALGHMVCRSLEIKTGLNWRLTGFGRYAWRELQYRGIASYSGGEMGLVSGGEFLGVLSRGEQYAHDTGRRRDRVEIGAEPG